MSHPSEHEIVTVSDADQAASLVLHMAMHAAGQSTFAVGGAIVNNRTGEVIHRMSNCVLRPLPDDTAFTWDPTAHGERQLVYWYYENREARNLPAPSELTVITSLDPCVMCAGALLAAGFNVGVIAIDDYAGINFDGKFKFSALPPALRGLAESRFGYYAAGREGADPAIYVREYRGGQNVAFCHDKVSSANLMGCGAIFADSSNMVRSLSSNESGRPPGELRNPAMLPDDSPIKQAYRSVYPNAFRLAADNARVPGANILEELKAVAAAGTEGDGNAVGFLDPFGNLVLCLSGREKVAPVRTAFMEVTQAYAQIRWTLMSSEVARSAAAEHLTVPKHGTFLFLHAPDPNTAAGIMTLGAYGSTMEGPIPKAFPSNFQYAGAPLSGTLLELTQAICNLPPLYTELVQIAIGPSPAVTQEVSVASSHAASSVDIRPLNDHRHARHSLVYQHKSRNSRA